MARELNVRQTKFLSYLLGESNGIGVDAARKAGYRGNDHTLRDTASKLQTNPDIAAAIAVHKAVIESEGIANRTNRISALNRRQQLMEQVIRDRAEQYAKNAPGADTGLLVKQLRFSPGGNTIEEWAVDTGLLRELRAHEEQAAKELGQWAEKRELLGAGGGAIKVSSDRGPVDPADVVHLLGLLAAAGVVPGVSSAEDVLPTGTDTAADGISADEQS
jgi:phage terminase small subunit